MDLTLRRDKLCARKQRTASDRSFDAMTTVPLLPLVAFSAALSVACAQPVGQVPAWLRLKIAQYEQLPVSTPPRSIARVEYQGRTVYYVAPICCDIPSELYSEEGTLLCFPDGGLAGGDGRCPSLGTPIDAPLVWRDKRVPSK